MIFISHRGNIDGKILEKENHPDYIINALTLNYDVEIDVWFDSGSFYLGHDYPQYKINESFLENSSLWCHAKNYDALERMISNNNIHCFWHQKDNYTITSRGCIWCYPGHNKFKNCIDVMPELENTDLDNYTFKSKGVCSDFIQKIRRNYNEKQKNT
tara:strand:+ start:39 stop:509 length:471 start_codon:yes stop_codon:yes gene_type:complete